MIRIVVFLTFIPWLLYYITNVKNALKTIKKKKINFNWIRKNIFKIFHFNDLILYGIFIYFSSVYASSDQIWLVSVLLFTVIYLYLFINSFYDKNRLKTKIEVGDLSQLLIIILITIIPFIFYISTKNYIFTYYLLILFGFSNYLIAIISKYINEWLLKIIKYNNR